MTDEIKLPEPAGYVNRVEEGSILMLPRYSLDTAGMQAIFTADQVRAAVLAERERAAKVCDERAEDCRDSFDSDGDERWLVYEKHAKRLAYAIRSGHSITETQRAEE